MRKVQLILLLFIVTNIKAQEKFSFKISKDSSLSYILNHIVENKKFEAHTFFIQLFVVSNPGGSAKIKGNDEVSDNIYITTSEFDEVPVHHLFILKDIYAARDNISFKENNDGTVDLKIGYYDRILKKKRIHNFTISLDLIKETIS